MIGMDDLDRPKPAEPKGCDRCGKVTRAYKEHNGKDYCDECWEVVKDLEFVFRSLDGTGEP